MLSLSVLTVGAGDEGEGNDLEHHDCMYLHDIVHAMLSPRRWAVHRQWSAPQRSREAGAIIKLRALSPHPSCASAAPVCCQQASSASAPGKFVGHRAAMMEPVMVWRAGTGRHL